MYEGSLCRGTAPEAWERVKLKVVSRRGKFIWDFTAGRIAGLCFHACAGWCFHTSHPQRQHLSSKMHSRSLQYNVCRKHVLTPLSAPSTQSLPLWPLTICLWERDPCLLPLFYLWAVLCLHGDTLMWIMKWDAGPACAAEVSEAKSIYSSWETAQVYLFSFLRKLNPSFSVAWKNTA